MGKTKSGRLVVTISAAVLVGTGLVSCSDEATEPEPKSPTTAVETDSTDEEPYGENVGQLWMSAYESDTTAVNEIEVDEPLLFTSTEEWDEWFSGEVPVEVQDLLLETAEDNHHPTEPDFEKQVVVAGMYPSCMEVSNIIDHGDGDIEYRVFVPVADQNANCYWSPNHLMIYFVDLDDLGVDDVSEVKLQPQYG